ncbi:MAG: M28 family peptidase [Sphingomonadales bacterium]|nr:M28 family peptidase [Sphingomonadales bacterium]
MKKIVIFSKRVFTTRMVWWFVALVVVQHWGISLHAQVTDSQLGNRLKAHVGFLAHDSLEGRQSGSPAERKAAAYIIQHFAQYNLQPAGDSGRWTQSFKILVRQAAAPGAVLKVGRKVLEQGKHFVVLPGSGSGEAHAIGVDAGYGIESDSLNQHDLKDSLTMKQKVWWMRWHAPDGANPHGPYGALSTLERKIAMAEKYGASALVLFPSRSGEPWPDTVMDRRTRSGKIPVLSLTEEGVALMPSGFAEHRSTQVYLACSVEREYVTASNVAGLIDNGADRTLVFGAHYDHLGYGEYGSSRHRGEPQIHNGADDNASGTAGLIELAAHYTRQSDKRFNYLFLAFSGEELGLLGSAYFVRNPIVKLDSVVAMLNMDMIGRLQDSTMQLGVHGTGTAAEWPTLVESVSAPLRIKSTESGSGSSDHHSFYLQNVPVLHFFTGTHQEYHKPEDDEHLINYPGMVQVLAYMVRVVDGLPGHGRLNFRKTSSTDASASPRFKVTLGIMPDYFYEGEGIKVDGVTENKPASKAGVLQGDILLQLGDFPLGDMQAYMKALSYQSKGTSAKLQLLRAGQKVEIQVTF